MTLEDWVSNNGCGMTVWVLLILILYTLSFILIMILYNISGLSQPKRYVITGYCISVWLDITFFCPTSHLNASKVIYSTCMFITKECELYDMMLHAY